MRPLEARVLPPPTVTSPITSSSAAAMTPVSDAASPKTTCARRRMASVFRRPTARLSPAIGPPAWRAPTASAVYRGGHLPQMAAMGLVRAVATKERTSDAWDRVLVERAQVS